MQVILHCDNVWKRGEDDFSSIARDFFYVKDDFDIDFDGLPKPWCAETRVWGGCQVGVEGGGGGGGSHQGSGGVSSSGWTCNKYCYRRVFLVLLFYPIFFLVYSFFKKKNSIQFFSNVSVLLTKHLFAFHIWLQTKTLEIRSKTFVLKLRLWKPLKPFYQVRSLNAYY